MCRAKQGCQSLDNWHKHQPISAEKADKALKEKHDGQGDYQRQLQGELSESRVEIVNLKQQVRNLTERNQQLEEELKQWREA